MSFFVVRKRAESLQMQPKGAAGVTNGMRGRPWKRLSKAVRRALDEYFELAASTESDLTL